MISGTSASGKSAKMAHFRILLVLNDSITHPRAIQLNSMGYALTTGETKMLVSSHNWSHSAGRTPLLCEKNVKFIPGKALPTVDAILNILVNKKRHHYKLHKSGSGCRYWTKVALQDLIGAGYMAAGSEEVVDTMKTEISTSHPSVLMLDDAEGQFF